MLSLTEKKCSLEVEEGGLPCLIDLWAQIDVSEQTRHGTLLSNRNNPKEQSGLVKEKQQRGRQMASNRLLDGSQL